MTNQSKNPAPLANNSTQRAILTACDNLFDAASPEHFVDLMDTLQIDLVQSEAFPSLDPTERANKMLDLQLLRNFLLSIGMQYTLNGIHRMVQPNSNAQAINLQQVLNAMVPAEA